MGAVYRARDERIGREVALKLPLPHLHADAESRARFLREGRAIGALDHPDICAIHQVGETDDGLLSLARTYYDGETLVIAWRAGVRSPRTRRSASRAASLRASKPRTPPASSTATSGRTT